MAPALSGRSPAKGAHSCPVLLVGSGSCSASHGRLARSWPSTTRPNVARNTVTAILKEYLVNTQREQRQQMRADGQATEPSAPISKYALPEPPTWRIHDFEIEGISRSRATITRRSTTAIATGRAHSWPSAIRRSAGERAARPSDAGRAASFARLATSRSADAALIAATPRRGLDRASTVGRNSRRSRRSSATSSIRSRSRAQRRCSRR